jgi:hypothetical protein
MHRMDLHRHVTLLNTERLCSVYKLAPQGDNMVKCALFIMAM